MSRAGRCSRPWPLPTVLSTPPRHRGETVWWRPTTEGLCEHDAPPNPGGAMTSTVTENVVSATSTDPSVAPVDGDAAPDDVLAELLIEEISIDGMCGVY